METPQQRQFETESQRKADKKDEKKTDYMILAVFIFVFGVLIGTLI